MSSIEKSCDTCDKEEIKTRKIVRRIKPVESDVLTNEQLIKDETLVKSQIEDLGISLGIQKICNAENCEEIECKHFKQHYKMKACEVECGVHSEVKCI